MPERWGKEKEEGNIRMGPSVQSSHLAWSVLSLAQRKEWMDQAEHSVISRVCSGDLVQAFATPLLALSSPLFSFKPQHRDYLSARVWRGRQSDEEWQKREGKKKTKRRLIRAHQKCWINQWTLVRLVIRGLFIIFRYKFYWVSSLCSDGIQANVCRTFNFTSLGPDRTGPIYI